jgi:pimeloyl-ACP methyl ester carboxylesterase
MDLALEGLPARHETPAAAKFAYPLLLLPELFTTESHLSLLTGYLAGIGWEVFAVGLYAPKPRGKAPGEEDPLARARAVIRAVGRPVIVIGHGFGGWLALRLADDPAVAAVAALAPGPPGFRSPLLRGWRNRRAVNRFTARCGATLRPPTGRTLFEFVAGADAFQREVLIRTMRPQTAGPLVELLRAGEAPLRATATPRLIVAGDADRFAPRATLEQLAATTGAEFVTLAGRGHWLIGGRALERVVNETQRFLVKALGAQLLLLHTELGDY